MDKKVIEFIFKFCLTKKLVKHFEKNPKHEKILVEMRGERKFNGIIKAE